MERSEAFQLAAAAPHPPYDLGANDYSELTEAETATLAGLEAQQAERAAEENIIREGAESALKSLRSMVQVMFGLTLGAIALGVFKSHKVPSWVVAFGTILAMVCFAGAIVAAICIARSRLLSLRWAVRLLRVRNEELFANAEAFVEGLKARKVYLTVLHYQEATQNARHVEGTDFFLRKEPSIKVQSIIDSSSPRQDLRRCYQATVWLYGGVAFVVLVAGVVGVVIALNKGRVV